MQSEFNSRRGMRGMNRDGNSRGGGIPFGANRFMGRGPPFPPLKPSGMRNREMGGPRMGAGDFRGGNFGGMGEGYFDNIGDRWEPPRSLNMRNSGSQLDDGNFFSLNDFGPGPDRGRFRQNNSSNFNSEAFRTPQRFGYRFASVEEARQARRMFQIPPGRYGLPPVPMPIRRNMLFPEIRERALGAPSTSPFGRRRRNAARKPQKQTDETVKKPSPPWFDEEVFKLLKDKGKAHKRMKRSNTAANVQAFKDLRKDVRRLTRQKYNDYCIKEGIPNKYTEAAKVKKRKAEEAALAKAELENNKDEASSEVKEKSEDTDVDNKNDTNEVVETNETIATSETIETNEVPQENNVDSTAIANNDTPVVENNNNSLEKPCDDNSMEDSAFETTES